MPNESFNDIEKQALAELSPREVVMLADKIREEERKRFIEFDRGIPEALKGTSTFLLGVIGASIASHAGAEEGASLAIFRASAIIGAYFLAKSRGYFRSDAERNYQAPKLTR